eukprot:1058060_1
MPTALCIFTLYLIIACIQTQRVTIYSWPFTSSTSGWHLDLTSSDSKLVTNTQCPGASSCYRLTNDDEFYIYVDTRTYTDIQIGYDIRSSGLDSSGDDYCEFWWMIGTATAANWEQSWIPQAQHFANDNPQSILHTSLPSDVDDYYSIGIDFWANMETSEYCYLNNVIVTGIPTAPTPTPKPTISPTQIQTFKPTIQPVLASNPSKAPSTPSPTRPAPSTRIPTRSQPVVLSCDDFSIGSYVGTPLTFYATIPFQTSLIIDASKSNFPITSLKAFEFDKLLTSDADQDGSISFIAPVSPVGEYTFILSGDSGASGIYHVLMECISDDHTPAPTQPQIQTTRYVLSTANPVHDEFSIGGLLFGINMIYIDIAVGAVVLLACCCAFCFVRWLCKKKKKKEQMGDETHTTTSVQLQGVSPKKNIEKAQLMSSVEAHNAYGGGDYGGLCVPQQEDSDSEVIHIMAQESVIPRANSECKDDEMIARMIAADEMDEMKHETDERKQHIVHVVRQDDKYNLLHFAHPQTRG